MKPTQRSKTLRKLAALLAVSALVVMVAPTAHADPDVSAILSYGSFENSPRGYLGCVGTTSLSHIYCFKAHVIPDGDLEGQVEIVAKAWTPDEATYVESAILDGNSIRSSSSTYCCTPTMTVSAELPRVGEVSLTLETQSPRAIATTNETCATHRINAELHSPQKGIAAAWRQRGTVDGNVVRELNNVCDTFFVAPTTGAWRMTSLVFIT